MKKINFILAFIVFFCLCASAQKNSTIDPVRNSNYDNFSKDQTLIILIQSEDEKIVDKLKKNNETDALEYYHSIITLQNETMKKVIRQKWDITSKIEEKTLDEVAKLATGSDAENYLIIALIYGESETYTLTTSPYQSHIETSYYYDLPVNYSRIILMSEMWKKEGNQSDIESICNNYPAVSFKNILAVKQLKGSGITKGSNSKTGATSLASMNVPFQIIPENKLNGYTDELLKKISTAIALPAKTKEEFYTENAPQLEKLILLLPKSFFMNEDEMPKRLKDKLTTAKKFEELYPYEFEIWDDAGYQDIIDQKQKGYAYVKWSQLRGNSDLSIHYAETGDMIMVTRPPLSFTNDYNFPYIRNQQVQYIVNAIKGIESE